MVAAEERKIEARKSAAEHEKSANKPKSTPKATKGKPAEQDVVRLKKGDRDHRFHVGEEVAVSQHHALGISCCATGVDQMSQIKI